MIAHTNREKIMTDNAIEKITSAPIVYNVTEEGLIAIENKWSGVPDCTTREGYKLAKAGISEVSSIRTSVEKKRKELKRDALDYGKNVDTVAKEITARLVAVEGPMREAKEAIDAEKKEEAARKIREEEDRVSFIRSAIDSIIRTASVPFGASVADIKMSLLGIENEAITVDKYQEFAEEATVAKADTVQALNSLISNAEATEAREAQLREEQAKAEEEQRVAQEKLRKEREEFEATQQAERELREAEEAEQRAKREEEQAKIDAEREKIEAEKEAMRAEKERQQAELDAKENEIRIKREAKVEAERILTEEVAEKERGEAKRKSDKHVRKTDIDNLAGYLFEGYFTGHPEGGAMSTSLATDIYDGSMPYVEYNGRKS